MKKILATVLAVVTALSLTACAPKKPVDKDGNNTPKPIAAATPKPVVTASPKPETPAPVTATPAEIEAKLKATLGENGYYCTVDKEEEQLKDMGLDFSKIESYVAKKALIESINPDTVIILKVKEGYADEAAAKLNESYANTVKYGRLYPFCIAKVENARLYKSGNIVALIIAGNSQLPEDAKEGDDVKLAEAEYAKIDAVWESIFGEIPENLAVVPKDDGEHHGGLLGGGN